MTVASVQPGTRATSFLKDYWLPSLMVLSIVACLGSDALLRTLPWQLAIGVATGLGLIFVTSRLPAGDRWQVWVCVVVATGYEIVGSIIWGAYRYRLHNLPLFVPFGHGEVFAFGLVFSRTPLVRRHGPRVVRAVFWAALLWSLGGITVLPLVTGRFDLVGAAMFPLLAYLLTRSRRPAFFAGIFVFTTVIELVGVNLQTWTWAPILPDWGIPMGNPPASIAGGYGVIDATVAVVILAAARIAPGLGRRLRSAEVSEFRARSQAGGGGGSD